MIPFLPVLVLTSTVLASQGRHCGRVQVEKSVDDRVIGGHEAQKKNWPWLVEVFACLSLVPEKCLRCSGTIVSDRHVLTAAHCFWGKGIEPEYSKRQNQAVVVSRHNGSALDKDGNVDKNKVGFVDAEVNVTVHHKYDYQTQFPAFDIAIVKLSKPITFSDDDQPICVVDSFRENVGDVGYVVGCGMNSVNRTFRLNRTVVDENGKIVILPSWNFTYGKADGMPHESLIQFRTIDRCESLKLRLSAILRHSERTFCGASNNRIIAQGDSGGPLMVNRKGVWYQVGVTSMVNLFDDDDGGKKWYSLYPRLSRACDWIDEVTKEYVKCASMDD